MKKSILIICCIVLILFECGILVTYFVTFNGSISQNINDWNLFHQLSNGLVISILTVINILVFYKISISLDVKGKFFETQSIITQMRVKQYEHIRDLIKRIQVQILKEANRITEIQKNQDKSSLQESYINKVDIEELKKELMGMENSFLYKNDNIKDPSFFNSFIEKICNDISPLKDYEQTYNDLSSFIYSFEFYIIQQLMRDKELNNYVNDNKGYVDSTILCLHKIENQILTEMQKTQQNGKSC